MFVVWIPCYLSLYWLVVFTVRCFAGPGSFPCRVPCPLQDHDHFEGDQGLWREVQRRRFQLYNREYIAYLAATAQEGMMDMHDERVRG
jgi:hypothetical protein